MPYIQIAAEAMCTLGVLRKQVYGQAEMARALGRHPSTISRELRCNVWRCNGRGLVGHHAPGLAVGIVACLQTRGLRDNRRPHRHLLVTDGGSWPDGTFVSWPVHDTARLTEAFRRAVLRPFVRLGFVDSDHAAGMLTWPRSGFHVHTAVWVSQDDRAFATRPLPNASLAPADVPRRMRPTPGHHAATFRLRGRPNVASDRSPPASHPRRDRLPTAHEAGSRDGEHAVALLSAISSYTQPTPIEIPSRT